MSQRFVCLDELIERLDLDQDHLLRVHEVADALLLHGLVVSTTQFVCDFAVVDDHCGKVHRLSPVAMRGGIAGIMKDQQRAQEPARECQGAEGLAKPLIIPEGFCDPCGSFDRCHSRECNWKQGAMT